MNVESTKRKAEVPEELRAIMTVADELEGT
jgi:hypothetical protein